MKITHCLREAKSKKTTPIYTYVHWTIDGRHHQWKLSAGLAIEPKLWDKHRVKAKKGATGEVAVNDKLVEIERVIRQVFTELTESGQDPLPELVRATYSKLIGQHRKKIPGVIQALDEFITDAGTTRQPRTILIYETVKKHLEEFQQTYGVPLIWASMNLFFFQKFTEFLIRIKGNNNQTLDKTMERLRAFLRHCDEVRKFPVCQDYKKFTAKMLPKGEQSRKVYLSEEELGKLEALDLSGTGRLARVRDLFLFLCNMGLRWGDAQNLRPEHRKGNCFELVTEKNRTGIRIPIHPTAERIWNQYQGQLPKMSSQKFNDYLKEVWKLAGIDELIIVVDFSGAQRRETKLPKYELITAHTAKRTFVTNLLLRGVSIESICEITGNSRKTIETYIVPTGEDVRREIESTWVREEKTSNRSQHSARSKAEKTVAAS